MSNLEKTRWAWVRVFAPLLIVAFGWSFLASYNCTIGVIPRSPGLESFSALTLIGVYIVARLCRHYNIAAHFTLKSVTVVAAVVIPLGAFRASIYNSPFCVVAAMCVFLIFTKIRIPSILARAGAFLAPSMFSVYLIHTSSFTTGHIVEWQRKIGCYVGNEGLSLCVLVLIIWVGGLLLDLPRRAFVNFFAKKHGGEKYRVA